MKSQFQFIDTPDFSWTNSNFLESVGVNMAEIVEEFIKNSNAEFTTAIQGRRTLLNCLQNLKYYSYWGVYPAILTTFCSPILFKLEIAVAQGSCHFKFCVTNVISFTKYSATLMISWYITSLIKQRKRTLNQSSLNSYYKSNPK